MRARVFPVALGIPEDEATGSAAVRLGALLGRPLTIHQGEGSVIDVVPRDDGYVEIGGLVVSDQATEAPPASSTAAPDHEVGVADDRRLGAHHQHAEREQRRPPRPARGRARTALTISTIIPRMKPSGVR